MAILIATLITKRGITISNNNRFCKLWVVQRLKGWSRRIYLEIKNNYFVSSAFFKPCTNKSKTEQDINTSCILFYSDSCFGIIFRFGCAKNGDVIRNFWPQHLEIMKSPNNFDLHDLSQLIINARNTNLLDSLLNTTAFKSFVLRFLSYDSNFPAT